jgi:hypothetical protein
MRKVAGLGGLAVGLDGTSLVKRDFAVVALAARGGAVLYLRAGEVGLYRLVDTGFTG